jgi:hypothetical protein
VKQARKAAAKWIADYKNGAKVAAKRGATTLKVAWARYKARLEAKGRSPTTIGMVPGEHRGRPAQGVA